MNILRALFRTGKPGTGLPSYRRGPSYDGSGAGLFVFEQETTLPALAIVGPSGLSVQALQVARAFRPLQTPQVYVQKVVPVSGIGGLQAGQIVTMPLEND